MSPLKLRLIEDRALRDAARAVVMADVDLIKADVAEQGLSARAGEAGTDYLRTMGEGVLDVLNENRGKAGGILGLAIAGLAAWFFREEIADLVHGLVEGFQEPEQGDLADIPDTDHEHHAEPEQ